MNIRDHSQNGFTLIELLVVISVLATMAGIAVTAIDSYDTESREQLAAVEMNNIANAIYRFKQDTGYFPKEGIFASSNSSAHESNFDFLFTTPLSTGAVEILPWQTDIARGWNGPYLTQASQRRLHIPYIPSYDGTLKSDCGLGYVTISESISTIEDTFEHARSYTDTDACFARYKDGQWIPVSTSGQPYVYRLDYSQADHPDCPTTQTCIALISAGKDNIFDSTDDLVTILRKNG